VCLRVCAWKVPADRNSSRWPNGSPAFHFDESYALHRSSPRRRPCARRRRLVISGGATRRTDPSGRYFGLRRRPPCVYELCYILLQWVSIILLLCRPNHSVKPCRRYPIAQSHWYLRGNRHIIWIPRVRTTWSFVSSLQREREQCSVSAYRDVQEVSIKVPKYSDRIISTHYSLGTARKYASNTTYRT